MSNGCYRVLMLAAISVTAGFAQDQKYPPTVRDYCVKVAPGKTTEFETYVRDIAVPLNQARAESGEYSWFMLLRGVVPAGSSARCDYRFAYGYEGLPAEAPSNEQLEAALKRARLNMSATEFLAKREALSQLVDLGIWYQIDTVGPPTQKGSYIRLNHYSVKPGMAEDWSHLETTYWKPLVETWTKTGGKGSWGVYGLMMPDGDNQPFNAVTVDVFPDWNSLLQGVPLSELWAKVHPHTDATEVFNRLDRVRSRHDIEVFKVVEVVSQAKSSSN